MREVAPPPAVVAAGSVSAFILADAATSEVLWHHSPRSRPQRAFRRSLPNSPPIRTRKYACLGELCPT